MVPASAWPRPRTTKATAAVRIRVARPISSSPMIFEDVSGRGRITVTCPMPFGDRKAMLLIENSFNIDRAKPDRSLRCAFVPHVFRRLAVAFRREGGFRRRYPGDRRFVACALTDIVGWPNFALPRTWQTAESNECRVALHPSTPSMLLTKRRGRQYRHHSTQSGCYRPGLPAAIHVRANPSVVMDTLLSSNRHGLKTATHPVSYDLLF